MQSSAAIPEVEAVLNRKLFYLSLPEVLKNYFLRGRHNLVVTGTHGKTTTTALLAWIMEERGHKPSYMIGGIPRNLGQGARFNESQVSSSLKATNTTPPFSTSARSLFITCRSC